MTDLPPRRPRRRPALRDRQESGTSLLEVVIACVLLAIMASAVLTIVLQTQRAGVNNRDRIAAANLAAREIDLVRDEFGRSDSAPTTLAQAGTTVNARPLTGGTAGQPLVVDGTGFTVTTAVQWNITGDGVSACDGGSLVKYPTLGVTVTVTWPGMGSTEPVTSSTALAPAKSTGVPTADSFIAVRVTDAAGKPNPGRAVRVTGGGATRTGSTDAQGCAVLEVSPDAAGTAYTAQISDAGYVDISGTSGPSKSVGTVAPGKLNNSVIFQVDLAGTVTLHLVDDSGAPLAESTATGASLTLVASQYSGTSGARTVTATGSLTQVTGLWPTEYGAYMGVSAPATGYPTGTLEPGGTLDLNVTLTAARMVLTGLPTGTTTVLAGPAGVSDCASISMKVVDPAAVSLLPGTWSFYASGSTFGCAPGPASVVLASGDNGSRVWEPTTIQITGAPAGTLWAVNRTNVTGSLTSCPGAAYASVAVNVDAARTTPVVVPAGDWYFFVTDGAAGGTCRGIPSGQYSKVLGYDTDTVLAWQLPSALVTVTGASTAGTATLLAWTSSSTMACSTVPSTATTLTKGTSRYTGTFVPGTWYFFLRSGTTCTYGGQVQVNGLSAYTLPFSATSPPTVTQ